MLSSEAFQRQWISRFSHEKNNLHLIEVSYIVISILFSFLPAEIYSSIYCYSIALKIHSLLSLVR